MKKIIGVIQVKGGAGRSTVSTNLAGELAKIGKTVLIDCDMPQGTSASWFAVRHASAKAQDLLSSLEADTAADHLEMVAKVELHRDADFIILDGPPRIAEITRATLMLADLCLVPVGASKAELWATTDILELVNEAKQRRKVNARMIWTRYRANTRLAQELADMAAKELGMKAMSTTLGMRVAYMEALGEGLTVAELPDQTAKAEIKGLVDEVQAILRKK